MLIDRMIRLAGKLPLMPDRDRMRGIVLAHFWPNVARSQNDEAARLGDMLAEIEADRSFVEFGFHTFQFNCVDLVRAGWKGLLLDGGETAVRHMSRVKAIHGYDNLAVRRHFLRRDALAPVTDFVAANDGRLGVLSIDIDGNDYWICADLLTHFRPDVLILEYNASFGTRPITVAYDPEFDRHEKHSSGYYHGASITAFHRLLAADYALVDVVRGLNLIFVRRSLLTPALQELDPMAAYRPHVARDRASGKDAEGQFAEIAQMDFVEV